MAPKLEHVFSMRGYIAKTTLDLGPIKGGARRSITGITHGRIEGVLGSRGEGLKVELISGGGDWILYDPDTNICHLDVRTQGKTDTEDSVYVYYHGFLQMDQTAADFLNWSAPEPKTTAPGEHYWFASPRIETSSEKFKWVETSMFVSQGFWLADGEGRAVAYEIYAVTN